MQFEERRTLFNYDLNLSFDIQEIASEQRDGVTIKDITFIATADKAPLSAYLVTPNTAGQHAGILWMHWLGEEKYNREEFLDEAVELARFGAISLLPNAMWSAEKWYENRVPEHDYANGINQVIEICRAMDLLRSQPTVDNDRMAFVGHDFGAMYGTLSAGLQNKARAYVFLALAPSFFDWAFFANQPESRVDYIRQNAVLEPHDYLTQIKDASMLFQYAKNDIYIGFMKRAEWVHHAPQPCELKIYDDADHSMVTPDVRTDRVAWLKIQLGLS
jgi:dienelactone hydrolase